MSRLPQPIAKCALVTGAGRRIGRAIAQDLAQHGYKIVLHARASAAQAEQLAREIVGAGGQAAVVTGDLADPARIESLIDEATAALGPLGLLINCAALYEADGTQRVARDVLERQLAVNTVAPILLATRFAAALPDDRDGLVVNILDQRVLRPTARHLSYGVSKSALWAATQMLAQRLAPRVRVMGIGPGPVLPHEGMLPEEFAQELDQAPLRHAPSLDDFGRTIRYFADTPSLTGQMLALDSGQHLG